MVALASSDIVDSPTLLRGRERRLSGIVTSSGSGDWFLFYDSGGVTVPDKRFPFLTLVTGDRYDAASHLDRERHDLLGDLGVDRPTYEQFFGPAPRQSAGYEVIDTGVDYTDVGVVMPYPFYAPMHWVCVVNPAEGSSRRGGQRS